MAQWPPRPHQQDTQYMQPAAQFAAINSSWGQRAQTPQRSMSPVPALLPGPEQRPALMAPHSQRSATPERSTTPQRSRSDQAQHTQRSQIPQAEMAPMVSYFQLPAGDVQAAEEPVQTIMNLVAEAPAYGDGPSCVLASAPSMGVAPAQPRISQVPIPQAAPAGSYVAMPPPMHPLQAQAATNSYIPMAAMPNAGSYVAPMAAMPNAGSYVAQAPMLSGAGAQSYLPTATAFTPAFAFNMAVPGGSGRFPALPVSKGTSATAPSFPPQQVAPGGSANAPSFPPLAHAAGAHGGAQLPTSYGIAPIAQGYSPGTVMAQSYTVPGPANAHSYTVPTAQPPMHMVTQMQQMPTQVTQQQPLWKFSPQQQQQMTMQPMVQAYQVQQHQQHQQYQHQQHQQPQQLQQVWSHAPNLQQQQFVNARQHNTSCQNNTTWPQNMTAKQALNHMGRSPSQQILAPRSKENHPKTLGYESEPVSIIVKEVEALDALTKTQEIYIYNAEQSAAGTQESVKAAEEVSFAAKSNDSVVIQGGKATPEEAAALINTETAAAITAAVAAIESEKSIDQCLIDSAEQGNLEGLCEAIRRAMLPDSGTNPDLIEWAHGKREVLEEQCWNLNMHRAAEQALQEALRGTSTEALKSAFERAQNIGVQGELFEEARRELQKRHARQDAEEGLYAALHGVSHGTPCNGLAEAINRASQAGVGADLVVHARRRLTEVEQYTCSQKASSAAEQKLLGLVKSCDDVGALSAALEAAQEAGVSLKVIDSARQRKGALEEHKWQHDLADHRPKAAPFVGMHKDEPTSGSTTPASTVGIAGELREEDVIQRIMRQPTRPLDEVDVEDAPSPIPEVTHADWTVCITDCLHASQFPGLGAAAEPMSAEPSRVEASLGASLSAEPVTVEASLGASFEIGGPQERLMMTNQLDETSNTTAQQVRTSLAEDQPVARAGSCTTSLAEDQPIAAPRSSWRPSVLADDAPPIYGLDAELKAKAEANYDTAAEYEASQWVQDITGVQVVGEFGESLRTGQVLCQLMNCIKPGSIPKINNAGMPFKERENITKFLKVCRTWGVHEYALFSTDDLYDEKNLLSVVKCLHQLGGVLKRAVPEFTGPHLGVADRSTAKRDLRRSMEPVTQTGGLHAAMCRTQLDILSTGNIKNPTRGGC